MVPTTRASRGNGALSQHARQGRDEPEGLCGSFPRGCSLGVGSAVAAVWAKFIDVFSMEECKLFPLIIEFATDAKPGYGPSMSYGRARVV